MEIIESLTQKLRFFKSAKLPLIRQKEQSDCAVACMAMIACYYGQSIALRSVVNDECTANAKGMSVREIIHCAEKINLQGNVQKIPARQLKSLSLPVILHWNGNHFVILKSVHDNGIYLHDPALGKAFVSWEEIYNKFTGIVIHLTPNEMKAPKSLANLFHHHRIKFTASVKLTLTQIDNAE